MSSEPNSNMDKLLKAYAEKRRDEAGSVELHPATRKMLQDEVSRVFASKEEGSTSQPKFWWWPRVAWGGALAMIVVGLSVLFSSSMEKRALKLAQLKQQTPSAAPVEVSASDDALKTAEETLAPAPVATLTDSPEKMDANFDRKDNSFQSGSFKETNGSTKDLDKDLRVAGEADGANTTTASPEIAALGGISTNSPATLYTRAAQAKGQPSVTDKEIALTEPILGALASASISESKPVNFGEAKKSIAAGIPPASPDSQKETATKAEDTASSPIGDIAQTSPGGTASLTLDKVAEDASRLISTAEKQPLLSASPAEYVTNSSSTSIAGTDLASGIATSEPLLSSDQKLLSYSKKGDTIAASRNRSLSDQTDELALPTTLSNHLALSPTVPAPEASSAIPASPATVTERWSENETAKVVHLAKQKIATLQNPVSRQNFAQENLRAQYRENLQSPPVPKILTRFQFSRNGDHVQIFDADGSVYEGKILFADNKSPAAQSPRREMEAAEKKSDTPQKSANTGNFSFRVSGLNRTLRKKVTFEATASGFTSVILDENRSTSKGPEQTTESDRKEPATATPSAVPPGSSQPGITVPTLQGRVKVGVNEFPINAVEVP